MAKFDWGGFGAGLLGGAAQGYTNTWLAERDRQRMLEDKRVLMQYEYEHSPYARMIDTQLEEIKWDRAQRDEEKRREAAAAKYIATVGAGGISVEEMMGADPGILADVINMSKPINEAFQREQAMRLAGPQLPRGDLAGYFEAMENLGRARLNENLSDEEFASAKKRIATIYGDPLGVLEDEQPVSPEPEALSGGGATNFLAGLGAVPGSPAASVGGFLDTAAERFDRAAGEGMKGLRGAAGWFFGDLENRLLGDIVRLGFTGEPRYIAEKQYGPHPAMASLGVVPSFLTSLIGRLSGGRSAREGETPPLATTPEFSTTEQQPGPAGGPFPTGVGIDSSLKQPTLIPQEEMGSIGPSEAEEVLNDIALNSALGFVNMTNPASIERTIGETLLRMKKIPSRQNIGIVREVFKRWAKGR